jgi:hypothetical protein
VARSHKSNRMTLPPSFAAPAEAFPALSQSIRCSARQGSQVQHHEIAKRIVVGNRRNGQKMHFPCYFPCSQGKHRTGHTGPIGISTRLNGSNFETAVPKGPDLAQQSHQPQRRGVLAKQSHRSRHRHVLRNKATAAMSVESMLCVGRPAREPCPRPPRGHPSPFSGTAGWSLSCGMIVLESPTRPPSASTRRPRESGEGGAGSDSLSARSRARRAALDRPAARCRATRHGGRGGPG